MARRQSAAEKKAAIYQTVTDTILATMEQGEIPWHKPWNAAGMAACSIDGHIYRGINVWTLMATAMFKGYSDPRWVTYKRSAEMGGQVRKGESSSKIVLFKRISKKEEDATTGEENSRSFMIMKTFSVFNVEQCDWEKGALKALETVENDNSPLEACEAVVANFPNPPTIKEGSDGRCWFSPSRDVISMAPMGTFDDSACYYGTLFHELAHSTGHAKRTGRLEGSSALAPFGSDDYGKEELVAELASALVCGMLGIEVAKPANPAAYIQNWMGVIQADTSVFLSAAQAAQRAADWILDQRQERDL